jgi:eukaryotic-like serine/threonine-protein kinase
MRKYLIIAISFTVCFAVAAFTLDKIIMPLFIRSGGEVTVPNVLNTDYPQAVKILQQHGFSVSARERFEKEIKKNTVLYQSPEGGAIVKKGRLIHLIISQDELSVPVPALNLLTLRDAQFTLESIGLKLGQVRQNSSEEFPQGIVIDQAVTPNSKILIGSAIDITISTGKLLSNIKVPFLISKSLADAKRIIVEKNLKLGTLTKKFNNELLPGTITEQSPDTSAVVLPLTPIDLVISTNNPDDE